MSGGVSVADWLDEYLQQLKHRTTKSAYSRYRAMIEQYWVPELGARGIYDVTITDLHMLFAKHEVEWRKTKLGAVHRALHIALAAAQRSVGVSYQVEPIYASEIKAFLSGCDAAWLPFWSVVLEARMSATSARKLTWSMINWQMVSITEAAHEIIIPISTLAALRAHHAHQAAERILAGSEYADRSFVFCRENGEPLTESAVAWNFRRETTKVFGSPRRLVTWTHLRHVPKDGQYEQESLSFAAQ